MEHLGLRTASLFRQKGYIGGKWLSAVTNKVYPISNPSNNKVICEIADMGEEDTKLAIDTAYDAYQKWRTTTAKERSGLLRKMFILMQEHSEDLSRMLTLETGKPIAESRGELAYGSSFLEWFAEEARRIYGEIPQSPASNKQLLITREPIGVAGLITPWNFPNAMITRKVGAALAAGCTCVVKPAEDTPLSALAIAVIAEEAGVPAGVLNVVTGSRASAPLIGNAICESKKVAGVSFTGSTVVGKHLYKLCSSTVKRMGLELGGNAPFIVFNSAKLSVAINNLMIAKYRNSGQTCISANRVFVQSGIFDEFVENVKATLETKLKVGDGFADGVNIGPLINTSQMQKVERIVSESVKEGAKVLLGGKKHSHGDLFFEPTLMVGCNSEMSCFKEEIFGPVIAIQKFETEDEAIKLANSVDVGLAGYFFSQDIAQVLRVSRQLEVGMVGVNEGLISAAEGAFGGIKESGIGREGSRFGIDEYTDYKYICIGDIEN